MAKTWPSFWLVLLALVVGGGACDDGSSNTSGVVSCTMQETGVGAAVLFCEELPASLSAQLQQVCAGAADAGAAGAGTSTRFADGPCSQVNALGGCRLSNGGVTVTMWYYQDAGLGTPADIQQLCSGMGSYVAP